MIRLALEDREAAVELFEEEESDEAVGDGDAAEGEHARGAGAEGEEPRDVTTETSYQYDEAISLEHTVRFETQRATLSETEHALLESFVTTVATTYE